jgi:hypothetical protein
MVKQSCHQGIYLVLFGDLYQLSFSDVLVTTEFTNVGCFCFIAIARNVCLVFTVKFAKGNNKVVVKPPWPPSFLVVVARMCSSRHMVRVACAYV